MRTTWAQIDEITREIVSKLNLTGDMNSDIPRSKLANLIGFDSYDDLALCIEKGKESDRQNGRS